jgi:GPH family glycoside/pentoside/hexuronide:cation symporter
MLTYAALDIVQSTLLYFLKHRMNLEPQGDLIFGLLFVAALISLPFWNWASRHWDKQKAYIGGMIFLALMVIGLGIIRPEWGLPATLVLGAAAGIGLGAIQVLTWAMIPDTIEWDELHTGHRHEGMYYSLVTLGRKVASSLALPFVLLVLDWTGYAAAAETQPASAILGIRLLIGPIPAVFLMAGIAFALFYPLNRKNHAEMRAKLSERQPTEKKK